MKSVSSGSSQLDRAQALSAGTFFPRQEICVYVLGAVIHGMVYLTVLLAFSFVRHLRCRAKKRTKQQCSVALKRSSSSKYP